MKKQIYLDYAASSPLDPGVLKAMMPFLRREWGNPSSSHSFGQRSRAAIENSRETVAKFLNCSPLEVVFTSGATEANNLAIQGVLKSASSKRPHVIVSKIEHESVLSPIQELEAQGKIEATYIAPNKEGITDPADVEKVLKTNTAFEGAFEDCFRDGLSGEQVGIIRAWMGKLAVPDPKIEVITGRPFAAWIFAGAVITLLFDKNIVKLLK